MTWTRDGLRKNAPGLSDRFGARMPDLLKLAQRQDDPDGPDAA